ncbi:uncharacterized protein SPAPADRAFT_59968 [Spathaspora passalidarum NRRL Y-27907]|uniref:Uncharacterized protein n=1 Tax=Spathaspora passalidarum (strain NRRL Y-27907 / 11-Y1) TaxID=619300 RepID=G3AJ25_SPAPN|nr:uncharacterized protein SPAPADRAFT_59968 [Spathaspora passalidarum NRRL Y-27907]EGW34537.1 hypothetical protein SPAPADRAFT_59968 [Spathaspora passalidarum NRRL Y-27907]
MIIGKSGHDYQEYFVIVFDVLLLLQKANRFINITRNNLLSKPDYYGLYQIVKVIGKCAYKIREAGGRILK